MSCINIGPINYQVVAPEALGAEGFGTDDIQTLFDWQDGKVSLSEPEACRMRLLDVLVLRFGRPQTVAMLVKETQQT